MTRRYMFRDSPIPLAVRTGTISAMAQTTPHRERPHCGPEAYRPAVQQRSAATTATAATVTGHQHPPDQPGRRH